MAEVVKHALQATSRYLKEWNMDPETIGGPLSKYFSRHSWFSIHGKGSTHVSHVHFDARVAIVYYPRVGEADEGKLVFEDPRGSPYRKEQSETCGASGAKNCQSTPSPQTPFAGNRYFHRPREGDLVVFPGWLYHSVDPVANEDDYRVSLSINIDGYWTQTVP